MYINYFIFHLLLLLSILELLLQSTMKVNIKEIN